jgi:pseudouridine-5'-phosphate glycosidase
MELSRTPVAVVCAGIKSILDIPRTLEFLETHSVPVVAYQTDQFPAFFTQDSGVMAHLRSDTPRECAELIHESIGLELPNGFVVAVPNPNPVDSELIKHAIDVRRLPTL